jgi:hypothetical protein
VLRLQRLTRGEGERISSPGRTSPSAAIRDGQQQTRQGAERKKKKSYAYGSEEVRPGAVELLLGRRAINDREVAVGERVHYKTHSEILQYSSAYVGAL